jgi:hypothetical protein
VIERKSPERGPRGKDRYGTITNPNPAGRGARGKAPRSPCIALRPRFGGASFLRSIQIEHGGYRWMARRLSDDGACFYLARIALAQNDATLREVLTADVVEPIRRQLAMAFDVVEVLVPRSGLQGARCRDGISQGVAADLSRTPRRVGESPGSSTHSRVQRKSNEPT